MLNSRSRCLAWRSMAGVASSLARRGNSSPFGRAAGYAASVCRNREQSSSRIAFEGDDRPHVTATIMENAARKAGRIAESTFRDALIVHLLCQSVHSDRAPAARGPDGPWRRFRSPKHSQEAPGAVACRHIHDRCRQDHAARMSSGIFLPKARIPPCVIFFDTRACEILQFPEILPILANSERGRPALNRLRARAAVVAISWYVRC